MEKQIKALIADDHSMVLVGLRMTLEREGIEVVGEAKTGRDAVELARATRPDVVILDIRLPDMTGLEALQEIRKSVPGTRVIMMTGYSDLEFARKSLSMGASGYISKDESASSLIASVRSVLEGEAVFTRSVLVQALEKADEDLPEHLGQVDDAEAGLTPQQMRVAALIGMGLDNSEIAEELSVSVNTVKSHISEVYLRLGVSDRTKVAVWAVERGLTS